MTTLVTHASGVLNARTGTRRGAYRGFLHNLKIHRLRNGPIFLVSERVCDNDLKQKFTWHQIGPQNQPSGND